MSNKGKGRDIQNQNYKAADGNMKTFNVIDYSAKTKISISSESDTDENWQINYRNSLIESIYKYHPMLRPIEFYDYVIQGEGISELKWNPKMIEDKGISLMQLRNLYILLENTEREKHNIKI